MLSIRLDTNAAQSTTADCRRSRLGPCHLTLPVRHRRRRTFRPTYGPVDNPQHHLRRGFNWLGGATIIAKAVDFGTILLVLLFLTRDQVGVASLVLSVGMVVEALEGFGTGEALVQARRVSRRQWDSVYWLATGASLLIAGFIMLVAPLLADVFGVAGMTIYFIAIAAKQPLTGSALVPLAMMNRALKYERIAIVNVCATLAAALTRIILAVAGTGAWAIVIGFSAHGLYMLIGAQLANPFRPRMRFSFRSIAGLLHFGVKASAANVFQQLFRNSDFLLIGWFYGPAQLAIYRVAFDIAMEPALAIGTLVTRTAMPLFARMALLKAQMAQSLVWSLRRLVVLAGPLMAALALMADPLTRWLHDSQGQSYASAAMPLKLLAAAAFLRVASELLYPLLLATGRPGTVMRLSALTLLSLTAGIIVVGHIFPAPVGIVAASAVWLAIYPLILAWGTHDLRLNWDIHGTVLASAFIRPAIGVVMLVSLTFAGWALIGADTPGPRIAIVALAAALTYAAILSLALRDASAQTQADQVGCEGRDG